MPKEHRKDLVLRSVIQTLSSDTYTKHPRGTEIIDAKFSLRSGKLFNFDKVCVRREYLRDISRWVHDGEAEGHFCYLKTLSKPQKFFWPYKSTDVAGYFYGFLDCQQNNVRWTRRLGESQPFGSSRRRWGCISTDFVSSISSMISSQRKWICSISEYWCGYGSGFCVHWSYF